MWTLFRFYVNGGTSLVVQSSLGLGLLLPQLLLLRHGNLLVELRVVALGQGLGRGGLLGLLGRRLGLLLLLLLSLGGGLDRLALLANVGLLRDGLGLLAAVGDDVLLLEPELVRQPDGQRGRLLALDVDALDVGPLLRHPLLDERLDDGLDVLGDLRGGEAGVAHADGRVGRGRQADERAADGLLDLSRDVLRRAGADGALGLLGGLLALAVDAGGLGGEHDWDGALGGALVEGLAEGLGQAVDDAVVGEEDVVLGVELALGLILLPLGLELADIDDAGDALAQRLGEVVGGDNVLVGALGVGGDEAYRGLLVRVERVREDDLAGLEAVGVGDVALRGEGQPDGGAGEVVFGVGEEVLLAGLLRLGGRGLLDVGEQRLGCLQGLCCFFLRLENGTGFVSGELGCKFSPARGQLRARHLSMRRRRPWRSLRGP